MEELHWCEQGRRSFDPVRQDAKKMTSVNVAFWRRKGRGGEEGEAQPALTGGKGGTTPAPGMGDVLARLALICWPGPPHHRSRRGSLGGGAVSMAELASRGPMAAAVEGFDMLLNHTRWLTSRVEAPPNGRQPCAVLPF
jgi:hypothetical protein